MPVQFQFRRGNNAAWTSANPVLAEGEMGIEITAGGNRLFKIGDGANTWSNTSYVGIQGTSGGAGAQGVQGAAGAAGSAGAQGIAGAQGVQGSTGAGTQGTSGASILPLNNTFTANNRFTGNVVVDVSITDPALRVTQRGTGLALRVEDDTNPDASPFVVDASGNVGIGTSTPNTLLEVVGTGSPTVRINSTNALEPTLQLLRTGGTGFQLKACTDINLYLDTANSSSTIKRILSVNGVPENSGSLVTLGPATGTIPYNMLHIVAEGPHGIRLQRTGASPADVAVRNEGTAMVLFANAVGGLQFQTSNGTFLPVERMRVDSAGRVGINTTNPAHTLDVIGTMRATSSVTNPILYLFGSNTQTYPAALVFQAWKDGTANALTSGQTLGYIDTRNHNFNVPARITFGAAADHTATSFGGDIYFATANVGTNSVLSTKMTLKESGRLGIGTASPSSLLHVFETNEFSLGSTFQTTSTQTPLLSHPVALYDNFGTSAGNGLGVRFRIADTGGTLRTAAGVGSIAEGKTASSVFAGMYFYTGTDSTEKMRITANGRVGIGLTAPEVELDVVKLSGAASIRARTNESAGISTGRLMAQHGSGASFELRAGDQYSYLVSSNTRGGTNPPLLIGAGAEHMRIAATGRVGIGTPSPAQNLHVRHASTDVGLRVETTATTQFAGSGIATTTPYGGTSFYTFNTDATGNAAAAIAQSSSTGGFIRTLWLYDYVSQFHQFSTNSAERMRITSTGRVGIGTTNPQQLLEVANGSIAIGRAGQTGNLFFGGSGVGTYIRGIGSSNTLTFSTNNIERMRIDANGDIGIGTSDLSEFARDWRFYVRQDRDGDSQLGMVNLSDTANAKIMIVKVSGRPNAYADWTLYHTEASNTKNLAIDSFDYGIGVEAARWNFGGFERFRLKSNGAIRLVPRSGVPETTANQNGDMYYDEGISGHRLRIFLNGAWRNVTTS